MLPPIKRRYHCRHYGERSQSRIATHGGQSEQYEAVERLSAQMAKERRGPLGSASSFGGLTLQEHHYFQRASLQEHHYFQRASLQVAWRAATAGCGTGVGPWHRNVTSEALQPKLGIGHLTRKRTGFHTLGTMLAGLNAAQAVPLTGR
jgi:hypothetical protein